MFNELGGFRKAACVKLTCSALQSFLCRRQKLILSAQCLAAVSSWQCAVFTVHPPDFLTFSAKHPFAALQPYLLPTCKLNNAKTKLPKKSAMLKNGW